MLADMPRTIRNKLAKVLGIFSLCFFLSTSMAEERWQVVIIADTSTPSAIMLTELHKAVSQRLTLALSAADFDVHSPQYLGLPSCIFEDCSGLTDQGIVQQAAASGKKINLALLYQLMLNKQRVANKISWHFSLSGRLLDLESGTEQDAFKLDSQMSALPKNCLGECFRKGLQEHAGLLAQELGAILSEKLANLSRRFTYQITLQQFTPDELKGIKHYLKNVDAYVSHSLLREFDNKDQWLHQVSTQELGYASQQSSSELASQLQDFLNKQGIAAALHYEAEQGLFTLRRVGTPYLASYLAALVFLLFVPLFVLGIFKQRQGLASSMKAREDLEQGSLERLDEGDNATASTKDLSQSNGPQDMGQFLKVLFVIFLLCVLSLGAYWHYDSKLLQAVSLKVDEDKQALLAQAQSNKAPIDQALDEKLAQERERQIKQQKRLELSAWYQARELNSIGSFQGYLDQWPQGQFAVYAQGVLKLKRQDFSAWQVAQSKDSIQGYQHYLDELPMGEFAEEVQEQLIGLLKQQKKTLELQELLKLAEDSYFAQQDYPQAQYYYRLAAEQGLPEAQYQLAAMYKEGLGLKQDQRQAVSWYHQAAEQGHKQAQASLGYMYSKGLGIQQSQGQALHWYLKAAEQGVMSAQYNLAYIYDKAQGTRQNYPQAAFWYEKAAEQGDADAQNSLGRFYLEGLGVNKDKARAKALYRQAASQGHQGAKINLLMLKK